MDYYKIELHTDLTDNAKEMFKTADYFEATNFSYYYDTAIRVFKYAHDGDPMYVKENDVTKESLNKWMKTVNKLRSIVGDENMSRVKVQGYKSEYNNCDHPSGESGFVFSLDGKLIGWDIWIAWIS